MVNCLFYDIIESPELHSLWLNTLSYMENCGARMIAKCEHPTKVKQEMLKHAAEEFRHAYYLKCQIAKIGNFKLEDYALKNILGGLASKYYLKRLNETICRYLQSCMEPAYLQFAAYVCVTFAIEQRAGQIYPLYQKILKEKKSKATVQSIILEEKGHLEEMENEMKEIPDNHQHRQNILEIEEKLYKEWLQNLERSVGFNSRR